MTEAEEEIYERGARQQQLLALQRAVGDLGYKDLEADKARWILEREATVAALRSLCQEIGDNDWEDDLHLGDVINKHLIDHLKS